MLNTGVPKNNHHVGSAPTVNPSLLDRQPSYGGESPEASTFQPGSLGSIRGSNNLPHSMELIAHKIFPHVDGNCMELSMSQKNVGLQLLHLRSSVYNGRGQIIPIMNSVDYPHERARCWRNEGSILGGELLEVEIHLKRTLRT